ncbi:MAG TPA: hypothetical protein DCR55_17100 [Lentisphaeria bacterium]|nr:hypothetical protein [Lentisphaeria bacterium]
MLESRVPPPFDLSEQVQPAIREATGGNLELGRSSLELDHKLKSPVHQLKQLQLAEVLPG